MTDTLTAFVADRPRCASPTLMGWQCRHKAWRVWEGMPYCWKHLHAKNRRAAALKAMEEAE